MTLFTISEVQLLTGFLVFVRVLSLIATNPLFGNQNIPVPIRVASAFFLSLVLMPVVPDTPTLTYGMWEMAARIAHETFIGVAMGFLISLLFSVVMLSGQFIGSTSGLQMASLFDPSLQTQVTVVGSLKTLVLFLLFLALDLHHVILRALAYSFTAIPPGGGHGGARAGFYVLNLFSMVFETAVIISLPVVLVVLVINLAMAIIARIAPQMNVFFAVGAQVNENVALILLALSFPVIVAILTSMFSGMEQYLADVIRQFR